jgi:hypothetical protein
MKLSILSSLLASLLSMGVPQTSTSLKTCFPKALDDGYMTVWTKFLETDIVQELKKNINDKTYLKYLVCSSFCSYILSIDKDPYAEGYKKRINLDSSFSLYSVKPYYRKLNDWLNRKRISSTLKLFSHTYDFKFPKNDFIRGIVNPTCVGIIEFKSKGRSTLDNDLKLLESTLFRTIPSELSAGRKFLRPDAQVRSKIGWVGLMFEDDFSMEVSRAQFNTLLIKYKIEMPMIAFYGDKSPSHAEKALKALHSKEYFV